MSSRIARVVIILILLATAIFLVALTMPVFRVGVAYALYRQPVANITPTISTDNQTAQETDSNEKLAPGVVEKISTLKPTDDIKLTVEIEMPVYSSEIRARAKAAIETLPDTSVICGIQNRHSLWVQTKVGNIEALAEMPEIVRIYIGPQFVLGLILQLLSPNNGSLRCPVDHPSFSWSPYYETTKFKFVLAKDAAMTQVVKEAEVTDTSYDYDGTLDYGTNYFWRVMALEPATSDWSATFSFQTEAAPPPPPEAAPQTITWPLAILMLIVIALAASSGIVTWLIISRRQKIKG